MSAISNAITASIAATPAPVLSGKRSLVNLTKSILHEPQIWHEISKFSPVGTFQLLTAVPPANTGYPCNILGTYRIHLKHFKKLEANYLTSVQKTDLREELKLRIKNEDWICVNALLKNHDLIDDAIRCFSRKDEPESDNHPLSETLSRVPFELLSLVLQKKPNFLSPDWRSLERGQKTILEHLYERKDLAQLLIQFIENDCKLSWDLMDNYQSTHLSTDDLGRALIIAIKKRKYSLIDSLLLYLSFPDKNRQQAGLYLAHALLIGEKDLIAHKLWDENLPFIYQYPLGEVPPEKCLLVEAGFECLKTHFQKYGVSNDYREHLNRLLIKYALLNEMDKPDEFKVLLNQFVSSFTVNHYICEISRAIRTKNWRLSHLLIQTALEKLELGNAIESFYEEIVRQCNSMDDWNSYSRFIKAACDKAINERDKTASST